MVPLIHNPRSAGGRGAWLAERARDLLASRGLHARLLATMGPGDAARIAEDLARAGEPRILAVGGDGTLSEVADGVLRTAMRPELGFLPAGTGNSFLLDFGVRTLEEGARRVAEGKTRELDAGVASWAGGERHFINVFGTGFIARVCDRANRRFKAWGDLAYSAAVFPETARLRSPVTRLVLDGAEIEERFALVAVCNTIHTGGAMRIAPMARADDGWLDVVALRAVGRAHLLALFPRIFSGSHVGHPRVFIGRAREVRIDPAEPSPLLGDGEVYGESPVRVRVRPAALRLLL